MKWLLGRIGLLIALAAAFCCGTMCGSHVQNERWRKLVIDGGYAAWVVNDRDGSREWRWKQ